MSPGLARAAPRFLPLAPAIGRTGTLFRPVRADCLTVCRWQALQSSPLRSAPAGGEQPTANRKERAVIAKKRITTIYPRDKNALSALARCGYVSRAQLGEFLREKRVQSYLKDGLIEKSVYSKPGSKTHDKEVYRLSKAGRELCRRELSLSIYNAQNPAHDLALADRYFALSQTERETWRTESQSRDDVCARIHQLREQGEEEQAGELWGKLQEQQLSMPDAIYTRDDGITVGFEVITGNYGDAEIAAKEETADALGIELEYQKT